MHYRSFNPRTPCGVRLKKRYALRTVRRFQSTHSLRSATNPPARAKRPMGVSIHALLAECDQVHHAGVCCVVMFQSTHSLRSATHDRRLGDVNYLVSIHALLAECDGQPPDNKRNTKSFNPRTPCGVRPSPVPLKISSAGFQSTHSLRSATWYLLAL